MTCQLKQGVLVRPEQVGFERPGTSYMTPHFNLNARYIIEVIQTNTTLTTCKIRQCLGPMAGYDDW